MSIKYFICCLAFICNLTMERAVAQSRYFTKTGKIEFTTIQNQHVAAQSRSAVVTLDTKTGEFQFSILMKSFEFEKALMQEKFNDQVLETDQFPKAGVKGIIENLSSVNFQKDGEYPVQVKGILTLHGISKDITAKGSLLISKSVIIARSTFNILINDYNVSSPGIKDISINVECSLESMN